MWRGRKLSPRASRLALDGALVAAVAAAIAAIVHASGGYDVGGWAPAGALAALGLALLVAGGLLPSRSIAAACAAFAVLGGVSVLSTAWGGIPFQSWRFLDQALIAAFALASGSALAAAGRRTAVAVAILAGLAYEPVELVVRALVLHVPADWFYGRRLQGPIGYHSAQANLCAIGAAIAVAFLGSPRVTVRATTAALSVVFLGTLLLTQSRAGALGAAAAIVVAVAVRRDAGVFVRVVPLAIAVAALVPSLRRVDRALVDAHGVDAALRAFGLWTLLAAAVVAGLCALPLRSRRIRRSVAAAVAVAMVAGAVALVVVEAQPGSTADRLAASLHDIEADPSLAAAGQTRLISLSLNGRGDAWRVAYHMARGDLVAGRGQGTFPVFWVEHRHLEQLYLLQPHCIFLELLSELGVIGAVLFTAALAFVVLGFRRTDAVTAAAAGAVTALVAQAAFDWTWSFPVLVIAGLGIAGAAASGVRVRPGSWRTLAAGGAIVAAGVVLFVPPWLSDRFVAQARAVSSTDPVLADERISRALAWNPWNAEAYEQHGLVLERTGDPAGAADDYVLAAARSQSPWLDRFLEARAAREAGETARRDQACTEAHAANPGEKRLYEALCG